MNPTIRFFMDLLGLTEEQIAKLKDYQSIEVYVGQLFLSDDPTVIRVDLRDLNRMLLNLPPLVMSALMNALTDVYQTMDAATQQDVAKAELDLAIGNAAGEGMVDTTQPSAKKPTAPPTARP